jgi:uncharacterized protein (TIGR03437 family)
MRILKVAAAVLMVTACAAAQPSVVGGGVINGASFAKGQAVAAGSVVSIFGNGLAAATVPGSTVPLSTDISGTSVTFNGVAAPLYFVSAGQVNAQVPWSMASGTANVVVTNGGVASAPTAVTIGTFSPAVFSIPPGAGIAIAINNADGSIAAPAGSIPGISTHPAKAGDALILYANGLGPVDSTPADGAPSLDKLRNTVNVPIVLVGGKPAQVVFSGLTPQFAGINQVNFVVPAGVTGNAVPVQLQMGGITSTDQVTIAVQ